VIDANLQMTVKGLTMGTFFFVRFSLSGSGGLTTSCSSGVSFFSSSSEENNMEEKVFVFFRIKGKMDVSGKLSTSKW